MKKVITDTEMLEEYDFSEGVRGKYSQSPQGFDFMTGN